MATTLGKRLRPESVMFSRTRTMVSSINSMCEIGIWPTYITLASATHHFANTHIYKTHLIQKRRQNHLPDIHPQVRLKLQAPLTITQQIPRQPRPILFELFIHGVLAHGFEPVTNGVEEVVEVGFIFPVIESAAGVADLVTAGVTRGFEDVPCLKEDLVITDS